ncbi:hypothetical protein [Cellulomonas sp.]|uniref:hypothetical protein n=1 Tax=Cellulomonas sp. TaxID=40001 RepID=UPI001B06DE47|nr:hypothetical protein [Cellulomonas sp.]MBO9553213.1 hypothetical protein [Cellulomonas sp.]
MTELASRRTPEVASGPGPTIPELLTMAADVVAMVDGHVASTDVGHGVVSVHVTCQAAAEYLAWRLALDHVEEYPPTRTCHAFAVWSGGEWPEGEFKVFCRGELVPPLRSFPRHAAVVRTDGNEAA